MKILVTGSRDLTDADLVHDALSAQWEERDFEDDPFIVVHGGARGADTFAAEWVKLMKRHGVTEDRHEATWSDGPKAGPQRNQRMIDTEPQLVLAFKRTGAGNVGTNDTISRARVAGIPVIEHWE